MAIDLIKGESVLLHIKTEAGTDPFGVTEYTETVEEVKNVLISPTSDSDAVENLNLYGKKSVYTLHIPREDPHKWTDTVVEFYGKKWRTFGDVTEYNGALTPGPWNKNVKVEHFG